MGRNKNSHKNYVKFTLKFYENFLKIELNSLKNWASFFMSFRHPFPTPQIFFAYISTSTLLNHLLKMSQAGTAYFGMKYSYSDTLDLIRGCVKEVVVKPSFSKLNQMVWLFLTRKM